jgi:hypothetical protein
MEARPTRLAAYSGPEKHGAAAAETEALDSK